MHSVLPSKPLSIWAYVVSLGLWLAACLGAAAIAVERDIRELERDLARYGDAYSDQLNKKMISSETILKGFSALFGAVGNSDPDKVSRYVSQVIDNNPQIFALEVVQKVSADQLVAFVARKRQAGSPGFTVKSFSYDSDRKWQALTEKPFYYPIVYMEPMPSGSEDVLGLDVESVPFLKRAMHDSLQRRAPVSSHPFRLVEGPLAYVVFSPIAQVFRPEDSPLALTTQDEWVVNMVVDAARLTDSAIHPVSAGESLLVYHRDFQPDDPKGQLLALSGAARSTLETALFPSFEYRKPLATMGEPFSLVVKRQVGWSDLGLWLLAVIALLALASSGVIVGYLRMQQQSRAQQHENQQRLWQLANHDALTGLPNRLLLMDRLTQLLARASRHEQRLAVLFLDLDDFKRVNDDYGHEVGDQLLKFVAERLRASIRADDTVARLSGDEFIILIEGVETHDRLDVVSHKIQHQLLDGFQINGQQVSVRASIGLAVYPEDGDSPDALIRLADTRMYAEKHAKTAKLHLV